MIGNNLQTILITGGNGFLGSHIVRSLIKKYKIVVLEKNTAQLERLNDVLSEIKIYDIDRIQPELIFVENNIDIILHTATIYGRNDETIETILATNFLLPFTLFRLGVKHNSKVFINTDTVLERTVSTYAMSKAQLRDWLQFYAQELKVINIQLEHFYGPEGRIDNFISLMIRQMLANSPEINLTKGEQTRDFVYYTDVVDAFLLIINSKDKFNQSYFNIEIASGERITIKKLVETIKKLTQSTTNLNFGALPYRENEFMESKANNLHLRSLGWIPKVSLVEGLKESILKEFSKKI